jgi:plasmid stabilization system protein ParE
MNSRFHEAADAELAEAVEYYDEKARGLGDRFLAEVKAATRHIERYPQIAPLIEHGVRAKVLGSFPYSVMYVAERQELFIVAIAHQSRRAAYWADRLPSNPSD